MRGAYILVLAALLAGLAACTHEDARPDAYGSSFRSIMRAQVLNPDAGGTAPVAGLYGEAAAASMDGYRGTFGSEGQQQGVDMNEFFTLMTKGTK